MTRRSPGAVARISASAWLMSSSPPASATPPRGLTCSGKATPDPTISELTGRPYSYPSMIWEPLICTIPVAESLRFAALISSIPEGAWIFSCEPSVEIVTCIPPLSSRP